MHVFKVALILACAAPSLARLTGTVEGLSHGRGLKETDYINRTCVTAADCGPGNLRCLHWPFSSPASLKKCYCMTNKCLCNKNNGGVNSHQCISINGNCPIGDQIPDGAGCFPTLCVPACKENAICVLNECQCKTGYKDCKGTCIPTGDCCNAADCPRDNDSCQNGQCKCDAGYKECNGKCIPTGNCCTNADCPRDNDSCTSGECKCDADYKECDGKCIPTGNCCTNADCPRDNDSCTSGECKCDADYKECNGKCIPIAKCCTNAECPRDNDSCQGGECKCDADYKECDGQCIPTGNCCTNADCPSDKICTGGTCVPCGDPQCTTYDPSTHCSCLVCAQGYTPDVNGICQLCSKIPTDIFFLADSTGSMGPYLAAVKANSASIMSQLAASPDIGPPAFGAGDYKDVRDPYVFKIGQGLTSDQTLVTQAINGWAASGGADESEAQLFALYKLADPTNPAGYRPNSFKIVVWFGDAPGHNPICPDNTIGIPVKIDLPTVRDRLVAANIHVIAISVGANRLNVPCASVGDCSAYGCGLVPSSGDPQATVITSATGGQFYAGVNTNTIVQKIIDSVSGLCAS